MTVSSMFADIANPNFTPCWLCANDVNAVGGLFCSEFDSYCCKDHIIDSKTCPVCDCEGVQAPHHMIEWVVDSSSENDAPIPPFAFKDGVEVTIRSSIL